MHKKLISVALVGLILNLALYSTAMAGTEREAKFTEKVKANIAELGTGKDAKVKIKLKDGTKFKGYVSGVKDSSFVLTSEDNGVSNEVQYSQVKQAQGRNSLTGKRILVIALIVGVIVLLSWGAAQGN